jgi:hypothetical protein
MVMTRRPTTDRNRIDVQGSELKYWGKTLGVTKEELLRTIDKVGNSAAAVRKQINTAKKLTRNGRPR